MIVRFDDIGGIDNHCFNCLFINKLLITNIMDKVCSRAPGFTTSCVAGFLFLHFFFFLSCCPFCILLLMLHVSLNYPLFNCHVGFL